MYAAQHCHMSCATSAGSVLDSRQWLHIPSITMSSHENKYEQDLYHSLQFVLHSILRPRSHEGLRLTFHESLCCDADERHSGLENIKGTPHPRYLIELRLIRAGACQQSLPLM